jgi:type I restriction enzyme, S subunit
LSSRYPLSRTISKSYIFMVYALCQLTCWGEVMATTIGECCQVFAGSSAPQDKTVFVSKGIPFVRAGSLEHLCSGGSLDDCEQINREIGTKLKLRLAPAGTILFAKSGMSAMKDRVYCLPIEAYVVSHLAGLIPSESIDSRYLVYWFLVNPPSRLINDPAYPSIRLSDISKVKFDPPSLNEQKRIAAILDKADEIKRNSGKTYEMKESLIRSAFIELFGDPIINPKGWPKQQLVDIAEKVTVGYVGPVNKYLDDLGVPMFRTGNVGNYFLNYDKMIHISRNFHLKIQKSAVMKNDVLINRHVTDEMKCSIVSEEVGEANCMNMLLIRPGELLDPFFLAALIQSKASQHELLQQKSGSAQQVVNTTRLRQWLIPVPPIKLQNQYSSFATKILSEMADNYQLQDIVKLRCSLIQKLIA